MANKTFSRGGETLGAEGVGKMIASGPSALSEEVRLAFEVAFGLHFYEVELPEPLRPAVASVSESSPVLTEALCAVFADPPLTLNLIEQSGRKVPLNRRTLLLAGLCGLLVAELLIGWLVRTVSPAVALKSAQQEAADLKRRSAAIQTMKSQNRELRSELEQLAEMGKTRMSLMGMLKVLSDTLPDDTYLRGFTYDRGDEIQIKGRSKKPDQLPQLLLSVPFVSTIEKSDTGEKTDEYFSFDLTAALRSAHNE
jgi:Tfp pilus assembly protein PilN